MKMALKIFVFALLSLLLPACNAVLCCANKHLVNGKFLQLQQTSGPFTLCSYGVGPPFTQCVYKGPSFLPKPPDCPPLVNAPICPITSVIHPKSKPGLCVTVPSYAPGVQVEVKLCNAANNQRFLFNQDVPNSIIRAAGSNFCLNAAPIVASKVTIMPCNLFIANQRWSFSSASDTIFKAVNRVIQWSAPGLTVQLPSPNPLQKWTIFP